jgi:hypothetical protein
MRILVQAGLGIKKHETLSPKIARAQRTGGMAQVVEHMPTTVKPRVQVPVLQFLGKMHLKEMKSKYKRDTHISMLIHYYSQEFCASQQLDG